MFLSFMLGTQRYAVDAGKVSQLAAYREATRIAGCPEFVRGVGEVDGRLVPVIDLRLCLGAGSAEITPFTTQIWPNATGASVPVLVDSVEDLIMLSLDDIRPLPRMPVPEGSARTSPVVVHDDGLLMMLDLEGLIRTAWKAPARWICAWVGGCVSGRRSSRRELSVPIELVLVSRSDLDGRFIEVSPDLERLSGYDADTLIGEYDEVLLHPDVPRVVLEDMRRDLGADRPWCGILKFRCRNGDHYWARVDIAPIRERGQQCRFRLDLPARDASSGRAGRGSLSATCVNGVPTVLPIRHGGVMAKGPIARGRAPLRRYSGAFKLMAGMLLAAVSGMVLGGVAVRLADGSSDGLAGLVRLGAAGVLGLILGGGICVTTVMGHEPAPA
jgi:purine-binding chemotaxis protein CheW